MLLLAIIGALSGSVDHQHNDQGDDGGGGYTCSSTGELDQEDWDNYFKHKDRSGVLTGYGDDIIELSEEKDRKSTRLNSSHVSISYAVFCSKKKSMLSRRRK